MKSHVSDCVPQVERLVHLLRENQDWELEARFGRIERGRFLPGVRRQTMDRLIKMMQSSSYFTEEEKGWTEMHDFFYRDERGRNVRTRVLFDPNRMTTVLQTAVTEKMESYLLSHNTPSPHPMDVRVGLKTETPVDSASSHPSVSPHHVRIKQHRRFRYEGWAFDFSITWSGSTKTEAEQRQASSDPPQYEVEVELVDREAYFQTRTDQYLASSLLLKMHDLVDSPSTSSFRVAT